MLKLLVLEEGGSCTEEIFLSLCFFFLSDLYSNVLAKCLKLIWGRLDRVMANRQLDNFDDEIYVDAYRAFWANQMLPDMKLLVSQLKVAMLHGGRAVHKRTLALLKIIGAYVVERILA